MPGDPRLDVDNAVEFFSAELVNRREIASVAAILKRLERHSEQGSEIIFADVA
jgi:hypothetical protein